MEEISTVNLLEAGLRGESLRQQIIANNIANLQTPGYRTLDVEFQQLLADALKSPGGSGAQDIKSKVSESGQTPVKANGNDVSLEAEIGKMIKNTLRHKACIRLISKKYQQVELAMKTSNR